MNLRGAPAAIVLVAWLALMPVHTAVADTASQIVSVHDLGTGSGEVWVFLPESVPSCIVTFIHDAGESTPVRYTAWLSYLAIGNHCAVVFPRYEDLARSHPAASDLRGLRAGITRGIAYVHATRFGAQQLRAPSRLPVVGAGFAYGGTLALAFAADASAWGLPTPLAVDSVFPTSQNVAALLRAPVPARTRVLIQVGDGDRVGGLASGQILWRFLAPHPANRKRLQVIHSTASLAAVHLAPLEISPAAQTAFWAPLDTLIETAKG